MSNNKSILIATGIFPPDIGGPATYAFFLAERLTKDGWSVIVATYSDEFSPKNPHPFKVISVWRGWPKGVRHIVYLYKIYRASSKVDLVYALNGVSVGVPARIVSSMRRKKLITRIAGDAAWEYAANNKKTSLLLPDFQLDKKSGKIKSLHDNQVNTCKKSDLVIVPSKFLAGIVEGWGVDPVKIKVIYNGVEPFEITQTKEEARKKLGIPGALILSYGRLVPWKGFRMLIKIMPKLLEINQFMRLVIVGDGPEFKSLKTIVSNMNLDRKVYVVGKKNRKELEEYVAASDMFVLNTGYEGFSHQILEAMSAGLPVITTPIGGNKEVMVQGENGLMVKYNDEFNLIEAIRTIYTNSEIREEFIKNGKETASHYSFDKMYNETVKVLET